MTIAYTNIPSYTIYHPHMPLLTTIVSILQYRESLGLPTMSHKIRGHQKIRSNDLAGEIV
jgi:hypothetical protein